MRMRTPLLCVCFVIVAGCTENDDSKAVPAAPIEAPQSIRDSVPAAATSDVVVTDSASYGVPAGFYIPAERTQLGDVTIAHFELLAASGYDLSTGSNARASVALGGSSDERESFECQETEISSETLRVKCEIGGHGLLELVARPTEIIRAGWEERFDSIRGFDGPFATGTVTRVQPDGARTTRAIALRYFTGG